MRWVRGRGSSLPRASPQLPGCRTLREGGHDITPQHLQGQAGGRPNNGLSFRGRGAFRGLGALPSPSGPPSRCSRTPPSSGTGRLPEQGGGFPGRGAQGPGLEARSEHGPGPLSPLVSQGGPQHRRFRHHHPDQVDLGRSLAGGSAAGGRGRGGRGAGPQGWALKEPTLVGGKTRAKGLQGTERLGRSGAAAPPASALPVLSVQICGWSPWSPRGRARPLGTERWRRLH